MQMVGNLIEKLWLRGQCPYIKGTERFMKQFLIMAADTKPLYTQSKPRAGFARINHPCARVLAPRASVAARFLEPKLVCSCKSQNYGSEAWKRLSQALHTFLVRAAVGHVLALHSVKNSPLSRPSLFGHRCCVIMFTWCFASGLFPPPVSLTSSGRCYPECLMVTRLEDRGG